MNELHEAACDGSAEHTLAVLSRGEIGVDELASNGFTALLLAGGFGNHRVVRILLAKGADVSFSSAKSGLTALHCSAQRGHLAVTQLLVEAGGDVETRAFNGATALGLAAARGHSEVMEVLIEAGANPNNRTMHGSTPLIGAAHHGHVDAVKLLLRAKADPLLVHHTNMTLALDEAALNGHWKVAHELIQERGIQGCVGDSGGFRALVSAASNQHMKFVEVLTRAGVVDREAVALRAAVRHGRESFVKFLLQQRTRSIGSVGAATYVDSPGPNGSTALVCGVSACSPRSTRLLVDAGADTTTAVRLTKAWGQVVFNGTPLAYANSNIRAKKIDGEGATESQLHGLQAVRGLLMRVEAVHAISWLWAADAAHVAQSAVPTGSSRSESAPTPLTLTLPILRRRTQRPRVLLAALFRWAVI